MRQCGELKILNFYQHFLNISRFEHISLQNQQQILKFYLCVLHDHIEGTMSQIFDLGPTFYFMKSRK